MEPSVGKKGNTTATTVTWHGAKRKHRQTRGGRELKRFVAPEWILVVATVGKMAQEGI